MNTSTSCTLFNGDETKCNTIIVLKRITAGLSIIGCLFMIVMIWLFKKYHVQSQRLVLYLSIAALFDAIAYISGDVTPDGPACDFEAWMLTYFDWAVLSWVTCITFNLYTMVIKQRSTASYEKYYNALSWLFPSLVVSLLPFIGDNYGPAGAWCWVKHDSRAWRFFIWYIPLFGAIVMLFASYGYIAYQIKRRSVVWQGNIDADSESNMAMLMEDIKVLRRYPFIYLSLSIFPLILRVHNAFTAEGEDVYGLWVMTVLTAPLQGAANAVVFGLDPDTREKLSWEQIKISWMGRFQENILQEYPTAESSVPYQKYDGAGEATS